MLRRVAYEAAASHVRASSSSAAQVGRRRCRSAHIDMLQIIDGRWAATYSSSNSCTSSRMSSVVVLTPPPSTASASGPSNRTSVRQYHVAAAPAAASSTAAHTPSVSSCHGPLKSAQRHAVQQQRRHMADNLLGHSPMARPDPRPKASFDPTNPNKPLVGVDSNTAGGGVWAQTSAKRDKLAELKLEIPPELRTLDDMATPVQKLDLDMADGLRLVARAVDGAWADQGDAADDGGDDGAIRGALAELQTFLDKDAKKGEHKTDTDTDTAPTMVGRERFEAHLSEVIRILEPDMAAASPAEKLTPRSALAQLRDFTVYEPEGGEKEKGDEDTGRAGSDKTCSAEKADSDADTDASSTKSITTAASALPAIPDEVDADLRSAEDPFDACASYLRLLTVRNAAAILRESWDDLTKPTDGDVDRAAVRGDPSDAPTSLALEDVNDVLRAYASGSCKDRVAALWNLVDKDKDGLIDEVEMAYLAHWSMKPVEAALQQLFEESLEELPTAEDALAEADGSGTPPKKKGWRQRRRDAKTKKRMIKLFNKAIANHFDVEVETPHRLRCIYAWAEKEHQNNRIDSVHIESGTIAGRKRYVELAPKISLEEFRSEQQEHFSHLDRVGEELLSSFREDLLVDQGKGRQNKQERRDMLLFLGAVSAVDAVIWSL